MSVNPVYLQDKKSPEPLTRSQHPDLRLFTQIPGKLAWLSNRSYKTWDGCNNHLIKVNRVGDSRRGVTYRVHLCTDYCYRVLAMAVVK